MLNKITILGSSSKGCAYLLTFENGDIIQLDAGIKNKNIEKVKHLFISHETHKDHDKFIKDFDNDITILPTSYNRISELYTSFKVPHKVLNNGYIIKYDNEVITYITDCGNGQNICKPNIDISKSTYLFIECNWDYFLIKNGIIKSQKHSSYAFSNEGHLSNLDCLNIIAMNDINKDCKIIFVHKSSTHSNYDTTYKLFDSLPNKKYIAKQGEILYVKSWKTI